MSACVNCPGSGEAISPAGRPARPRAPRRAAAIVLDGRLDEADWQAGAGRVRLPAAGPRPGCSRRPNPPKSGPVRRRRPLRRRETGATGPARIARQLSRRDALAEADTFTLYLDPNHDRLTGVALQVSAAGVQRDTAIYDDNFEDETWDAVWASAVAWVRRLDRRDARAVLPAPIPDGARPHLGGQRAPRRAPQEREHLARLVPRNEGALASRMSGLEGIPALEPPRHLELLPYVSGRAEWVEPGGPGTPSTTARAATAAPGSISARARDQPGARRRGQPRLRPGRGRPRGRQPHRVRDVLPGEAPLLHRGQPGSCVSAAGRAINDLLLAGAALFYSRRIGRSPQGRPPRLRGPPTRPRSSARPRSPDARPMS